VLHLISLFDCPNPLGEVDANEPEQAIEKGWSVAVTVKGCGIFAWHAPWPRSGGGFKAFSLGGPFETSLSTPTTQGETTFVAKVTT
jgi:hypothetical protein